MNLLDAALNKQNNLNGTSVQKNEQVAQNNAIHAHNLLKWASDTFEPVSTDGLIKPDRPQRSYIVDDPFYMAPINFLNDIKENIINIKNGIQGKSNDHDLGRMNDFAMKAGALGLAGYLFTRGKSARTKAMEFVGFGAFFAAMALWPKLFIQAPIKAMYGLDIHQRYVDNEGRKKMFFQDPQYIPWNLYTDEELSALGDRLGVPKDVHNRNEVIRKKAHKIALQGNTLWMLTAGFATPLFCALGCNGIEKLFNPPSEKSGFPRNVIYAMASSIEKRRIDKAEDKVKNSAAIASKKLEKYEQRKLNALLGMYKNRPIDDELIEVIAKELSHDSDLLQSEYVSKQIKDIVKNQSPSLTKDYATRLYSYIMENIETFDDDVELNVLADKKAQIEQLAEKSKNLSGFTNSLLHYVDNLDPDNEELLEEVRTLCNDFKAQNSKRILTIDDIEQLRVLDKKLYEFSIKKQLLDHYNLLYFNNAEGTIAANRWNNVSKAFFNSLGLSSEEIAKAKQGEDAAYKLVVEKLENLAKDDEAYKNAFSKVYTAVLDFDKTVLPDAPDGTSQGIKSILEKRYTTLFDEYAEVFDNLGFSKIKERLVGGNTRQGCLKDNVLDRISRRINELRNGMYKFLQVLDFFKRAGDIEKEGQSSANGYLSYRASNGLDLKATKETLMSDIAKYKALLVKGTIADYTTKSGLKNPQVALYDRMMKYIFTTDFADSTKEILGISDNAAVEQAQLGETTFVKTFTKKIQDTLANLGNFSYPHAEKVTTLGVSGGGGDILVRDSLAGPRIDRVVRETASEVFNTSKWLKMFGGATAALIGVTLLAEVFFGNLKKHDVYSKKDKR